MNSTEEIRSAEIERRIARHLEEIDAELAARGQDIMQRRSVTNDVESQIRDMLAGRAARTMSGQPVSVADVEAVLAELDPPASYAMSDATDAAMQPLPVSVPGRLSRSAVLGACWLPLGMLGVVMLVSVHVAITPAGGGPPPGPTPLQEIAAFVIGGLSLVSPVGVTALGMIAITQIRRSNGAMYGMPLALFDALVYPLLLLDFLLAVLVYYTFAILANWHELGVNAIAHPNRDVADDNFAMVIAIAAAVAVFVDYLLVKRICGSLRGNPQSALAI